MKNIYIISNIILPSDFAKNCGNVTYCHIADLSEKNLRAADTIINISTHYSVENEKNFISVSEKYGCGLLSIYLSEEYIVFGDFGKNEKSCMQCWCEHLADNGLEYVLCGRKGGYSPDDYFMHIFFMGIMLKTMLSETNKQFKNDYVYVFSLRSRKLTKHKIIRHERCICSHIVQYRFSSDDFLTDKGDVLNDSYRIRSDIDTDQIKDDICDSMSGIIRNIYKDMNSSLIPLVVCEMMSSNGKIINGSYGRSMSFKGSESSAILEMLERYSVMWPKNKVELIHSSYAGFDNKAYDPEKFILPYHKGRNKNFKIYSPSLEFDWVKAYQFTTGKEIYIPAQLAYYDLDEIKPDVNRFVYETSNGSAIGGSLQEAVLYGLLEVIERDSFMTAWYNKLRLPVIDMNSIRSSHLKRLIAQAERYYELYFFNSTSDNDIPAVICIALNKNEDSLVSSYLAAGCHIDAELAIESALVEVISSIPVYERGFIPKQDRADLLFSDPENVTEMEDHVLLYSRKQLREQYSFLFNEHSTCSIDNMERSTSHIKHCRSLFKILNFVCDSVLKNCEEILVVDCSNDIIAKYGLYAAKVLVPGMLPMTFGNQNKRVNMERIRKIVKESDHSSYLECEETINMFPHPFP